MRVHHTKNKGDLGVLHAELDLVEKGYSIFRPISEHEAFDLVAYKDERFFRVQVKYRAVSQGSIRLNLAATWADRNGNHRVPIDRQAIDLICIYCPDTKRCYYVDLSSFGGSVCLRVEPCRNNQAKDIIWAKDFLEVPALVRGIPTALRARLEEEASVVQSS